MLVLTTAGVVVALATLWYTRKEYQSSTKGVDESPNKVTKDDGEGVPLRHSEKGLDTYREYFLAIYYRGKWRTKSTLTRTKSLAYHLGSILTNAVRFDSKVRTSRHHLSMSNLGTLY